MNHISRSHACQTIHTTWFRQELMYCPLKGGRCRGLMRLPARAVILPPKRDNAASGWSGSALPEDHFTLWKDLVLFSDCARAGNTQPANG